MQTLLIVLGCITIVLFVLSFLPIWKVPFRVQGLCDSKGMSSSLLFSVNTYSLWSEEYAHYIDTLKRNPSITYYVPLPFVG